MITEYLKIPTDECVRKAYLPDARIQSTESRNHHVRTVSEYSWTSLIFGPGVHISWGYLDPRSIHTAVWVDPFRTNGPLPLTHESGDDAKSLHAHTDGGP